MNVQIIHEGSDRTDYVVSYTREKQICSGIGTLDVEFAYTVPGTFVTWDTIVLYEEGNKKGTYFITDVNRSAEKGTLQVQCQDGSKKLTDYFISDQYVIDYYSTSRYWIELFLTEVGVSYNFTTSGTGTPISNDTILGLASAYDIVMALLSQSGWYMHFNQNNVVQIGDLNKALSNPAETFNNTDIISIESKKHDSMLRNRAVVWGKGDPVTGTWIFADVSKNTPWNYDSRDKRAVVYSNSYISDFYTANILANTILSEFARINNERTVTVWGGRDIDIGDVVYIRSGYGGGAGLVTTLNVNLSSSGFVTTLTLDQRCPRLFGYYGFDTDYVYIGTLNNGIWRKLILGSSWSDFSTGLDDLSIRDLSISNGQFACVSFGGIAYRRDVSELSWSALVAPDFTDNTDLSTVLGTDSYALACVVDQATSEIYVLYGYNKRGWVVHFDALGSVIDQVQIGFQDFYGYTYKIDALDVDTNTNDIFATITDGNFLISGIGSSTPTPGEHPERMFTTNNLNAYTRTFGHGLVTGQCSNSVHFNGSVYYATTVYGDPTLIFIVKINHTGTPVVVQDSNQITTTTPSSTWRLIRGTGNELKLIVPRGTDTFEVFTYSGGVLGVGSTVDLTSLGLSGTSTAQGIWCENLVVYISFDAFGQTDIVGYDFKTDTFINYIDIFPNQTGHSWEGDWATGSYVQTEMSDRVMFYTTHFYGDGFNPDTAYVNTGYIHKDTLQVVYNQTPVTCQAGNTVWVNWVFGGISTYFSEGYIWSEYIMGPDVNTLTTYTYTIDALNGGIVDQGWAWLEQFDLSVQGFALWQWSTLHGITESGMLDIGANIIFSAYTPTLSVGDYLIPIIDYLSNDLYAVSGNNVKKIDQYGNNISIAMNNLGSTYYSFGENVIGIRGSSISTITFKEFGTWAEIAELPANKTLIKEEDGTFTVIDTTDLPQRLELSLAYPTTTFGYTYGTPVSGYVPISGEDWIRVQYVPGAGAESVSGVENLTDLRLFSLFPDDPFYIDGIPYTQNGYISAGVYASGFGGLIHDVDPVAGEWATLLPVSGAVGRFETTNYGIPYFFISTTVSGSIPSGVILSYDPPSASGITTFYQRNPDYASFIDYSYGLPGSEITVIRVDDRL